MANTVTRSLQAQALMGAGLIIALGGQSAIVGDFISKLVQPIAGIGYLIVIAGAALAIWNAFQQ